MKIQCHTRWKILLLYQSRQVIHHIRRQMRIFKIYFIASSDIEGTYLA